MRGGGLSINLTAHLFRRSLIAILSSSSSSLSSPTSSSKAINVDGDMKTAVDPAAVTAAPLGADLLVAATLTATFGTTTLGDGSLAAGAFRLRSVVTFGLNFSAFLDVLVAKKVANQNSV